MSSITWHYVLKFIITGDAAVGKSSLLVRLTDQRFLTNPDPTLGVEFGSKLISIPDEDKIVKLQCWDTAAGCLLVYDVTNRKSFANTKSWLADVREHADPHLTCILVGNKVDICDESLDSPSKPRQVTTEEGVEFARQEGLLFVEASAKSGLNVELAFVEAARDILNKIKTGVFDDSRSPGVKTSNYTNPNSLTLEQTPPKGTCCS